MNKTAIKNYAIWARVQLIEAAKQKAYEYAVTDGENVRELSAIGGRLLTEAEKKQRRELLDEIRQKGYQQVMEEAAYTWFNRFIALRFMEVNGYLPSMVRVFTDETGAFKPEILKEAMTVELAGLDRAKVLDLIDKQNNDELYQYLLITQCNALNDCLPQMFERIDNWTELLFPKNLLRPDGVLGKMISMIPEEDWTDQVQIIGWLYQYYNVEPKDTVFSKKGKITKEEVPAATQLFTPDWIVRYMVENSLGRLWLEGHPNDDLKSEWKYYLDEAEQEPEVQKQLAEIRKEYAKLNPEDIKVIDPCMGSGHILVVLFDVLLQIYEACGYSAREAVSLIVEKNLYGLDIDERAAQLAYFAVMMKARKHDRRFFTRGIQPRVYAIRESNSLDRTTIDYFVNLNPKLKAAMDTLTRELYDAKEYGSILNVTQVDFDALYSRFEEIQNESTPGLYSYHAIDTLLPFVKVAQAMAQKYHITVTNPPYMSVSNGSPKLNDYVRVNYSEAKADLYAVFMKRCNQMTVKSGFQAMITQHGWMFLGSFEKLRIEFAHKYIVNMAHLGARAFEEIAGEVVQTTTFVVRKNVDIGANAVYERLVEYPSQDLKERAFLSHQDQYTCANTQFHGIPGMPFAYWISKSFAKTFSDKLLGDYAQTKQGFATGSNDLFLRFWHETSKENSQLGSVSIQEAQQSKNRWFPCNKGGSYRKWYGNNIYLANWWNDGYEMRNFSGSVIRNPQFYFREGITWSSLANQLSLRFSPEGFIFESKGSMCYPNDHDMLLYLLGLLNSKTTSEALSVLSPTLDFHEGPMSKVPVVDCKSVEEINEIVKRNIEICKEDWDSFETSWDFRKHPLVPLAYEKKEQEDSQWGKHRMESFGKIEYHYRHWVREAEDRFNQLKANEEELNRIFIDIYGLQDELTPEVEDKDVTVRKADLQREIRSLISYAVGCMFGRYCLDKPGLVYAGGDFETQYRKDSLADESGNRITFGGIGISVSNSYTQYLTPWNEWRELTFSPDTDNIIPICDDEYFEDDIVCRFVKFIEAAYGKDSLEENLKFIADALGGKGTPRQVIRSYFLNDFYSDHLKIYQKRPIYWLFDSGKKNGFKCLIYMHRYQPDTIARIRTDYVHEQQERYRSQIQMIEDAMQSASTSERVKLNKQLTNFKDQALELQKYEEKIHHLADQAIAIDLDDGVKVNYAKFEDVLAKIK